MAWFAQTSHGFRRGNAVSNEGGALRRATLGSSLVGLVGSIRDRDRFEVVTNGEYLVGMAGLTPGQLYYLDASGDWTTTATAQPVFRAKNATSGWVTLAVAAGDSSGSGGSSAPTVTLAELGGSPLGHDHDERYVLLPAAGGVLDIDDGNLVFDIDSAEQVVAE